MGPLWVPRFTVYTNPVKNECLCGVHYNPMCLLLTPLLSPIIIWMAEMLFLLGEKHLLFLSIFSLKESFGVIVFTKTSHCHRPNVSLYVCTSSCCFGDTFLEFMASLVLCVRIFHLQDFWKTPYFLVLLPLCNQKLFASFKSVPILKFDQGFHSFSVLFHILISHVDHLWGFVTWYKWLCCFLYM